MRELKFTIPERALQALFGPYDQNIKYLESLLSVKVGGRGSDIFVEGDEADVATVEQILKDFSQLFSEGKSPADTELRDAFKQVADDRTATLRELVTGKKIINPAGRKQISARTANQRRYIDAIDNNDVVFGIGVAGTGKTYLAVAMAVQYLMTKRVNRVVLARPAVEAGEKLGFLPGDLQDKVDPYLRPIYDALFDVMDHERVTSFLEKRVIEVAPLAFMRGRAQPLDSLIATPLGWKPMGEIRVDDLVIGSDGRPTKVLGVFPQGRRQVFRLRTEDGASVEACAEHLWQVRSTHDAESRTLTTAELTNGIRQGERYQLPMLSGPVEWSERPLAMAMRAGAAVDGPAGKSAAVSNGIPAGLLFSSIDKRWAFTRELLASASTIDGTVRLRLESEALIHTAIAVIRSLGGLAWLENSGPAAGMLSISLPGSHPARFVEAIQETRYCETQCIKVAAEDSLYMTEDFILTHNTLSDAFIILDEAQNTTSEQMKMFLTRIGFGSKAVITGDVTQIDLPTGRKSGLIEAQRVVRGINGIEFIDFTERDVVRHHIVQLIVKAYDEHTRKVNI